MGEHKRNPIAIAAANGSLPKNAQQVSYLRLPEGFGLAGTGLHSTIDETTRELVFYLSATCVKESPIVGGAAIAQLDLQEIARFPLSQIGQKLEDLLYKNRAEAAATGV